jgi:hypothetical protein
VEKPGQTAVFAVGVWWGSRGWVAAKNLSVPVFRCGACLGVRRRREEEGMGGFWVGKPGLLCEPVRRREERGFSGVEKPGQTAVFAVGVWWGSRGWVAAKNLSVPVFRFGGC